MNSRRFSTAVASFLLAALASSVLAPAMAGAVATWSTIPADPGPGSRYSHSAAFDPDSNRMIVFSGADRNQETWSLSLNGTPHWDRLMTVASPSGRSGARMVFDPLRRRMILFGGNDATGSRNDAWALSLDGTPNWSLVVPSGSSPIGRADMAMVYDSLGDRILIMGGLRQFQSQPRNDVWALSLSGTPQWTQILPLGPPPAIRYGHVGIFDPVRNRMLIWGGGVGSDALVWSLELGSTPAWTSFDFPEPPAIRQFATAIRDPVGDRMVIFGGAQPTNEVLSLELAGTMAWTVRPETGTPPSPRHHHTAVYDPGQTRMIVYGGQFADDGVYAYAWDPPIPVIDTFVPDHGVVGDVVWIYGSDLLTTSEVRFNGTPVSPGTVYYHAISVHVPPGATTGPISVVTAHGTVTSSSAFTVGIRPRIDAFSPAQACLGDSVVIQGAGFTGATFVALGSDTTAPFTVRSDVEIVAQVDASAGIGPVKVGTIFGGGASSTQFRKLTHDECVPPPQPPQPLTRLWDPDGRPIVAVTGVQSSPVACSDGSGGALIVWQDTRAGGGRDLYATHIDEHGNTVAGWTPGGDPICVDPSSPSLAGITSDEQGGAIVAWIDARTGISRLYATRMTFASPRHPSWTLNGVRVSDDSLSVNRGARVAPDGAGGAYFSWVDSRPEEIYVIRRDGDGAIPPGWEAGGLPVGYVPQWPNETVFSIPDVMADGAGGVLVAMTRSFTGPSGTGSISGIDRISADGVRSQPIWFGSHPEFHSDLAEAEDASFLDRSSGDVIVSSQEGQQVHRVTLSPPAVRWSQPVRTNCPALAAIPDGIGGHIFTWHSYANFDLEMTGIQADGSTPVTWPTSGYVLTDEFDSMLGARAISDDQGGMVVAWLQTPHQEGPIELYGQHVGQDGGMPTGTEDGVLLVTAPGIRTNPTLVPSTGHTALLIWQDSRNGGDLYAQRLTWDDVVSVPPVGVPVATQLTLRGASPNPSSGPLRIAFSLASGHPARLEVFDVAGRRVDDRSVGELGPGRHVVSLGEGRLPPGLYLIRLEQNGTRRSARALVVK
jgi:hypothetical protein